MNRTEKLDERDRMRLIAVLKTCIGERKAISFMAKEQGVQSADWTYLQFT